MALHKTLLDALGPWGWRMAHQLRLLWWRVRRPVNLGVGGIILNGRGEVLLVRHSYQPHWMLPGGAVDWGENAEQALSRELMEECHLTISAPRLLEVRFIRVQGACNHVLIYRAQAQGEGRKTGSEIMAIGWFSPANLPVDVQPRSRDLIAAHSVSA